jgi:hypothetical protein
LGGAPHGLDIGFFDAGGDSIQAAAFMADVERRFGVDVPIGVFIVNATARRLAVIVEGGASSDPAILVPVKRGGRLPPFFCVHPHDGRATLYFGLAKRLEDDRPFYAFQAPSEEALRPAPGGIERMAGRYIEAMQALRPEGPYLIGGYCFGALVAFEMARKLAAEGVAVGLLALMDGYAPAFRSPRHGAGPEERCLRSSTGCGESSRSWNTSPTCLLAGKRNTWLASSKRRSAITAPASPRSRDGRTTRPGDSTPPRIRVPPS